VTTEIGKATVEAPAIGPARSSPRRSPRWVRRLDGVNANVASLYAKGMTTGDIQAHLGEIHGTDDLPGHDQPHH
jgi:putative transposase